MVNRIKFKIDILLVDGVAADESLGSDNIRHSVIPFRLFFLCLCYVFYVLYVLLPHTLPACQLDVDGRYPKHPQFPPLHFVL